MIRLFLIIFSSTLFYCCSPTKHLPKKKKVLTSKYTEKDTLVVKISYQVRYGCIVSQSPAKKLIIGINPSRSVAYQIEYMGRTVKKLAETKQNLLEDIKAFEESLYTPDLCCGSGYGPGGMIEIEIEKKTVSHMICLTDCNMFNKLVATLQQKSEK